MRVLVDTSAWVDFFNGHSSPESDALVRLLRDEADILTCGLVTTEVLQGLRRSRQLRRIEQQFVDMDWLTPQQPDTYLTAAALFRDLRVQGLTIRSTVDCLIASLAAESDALLLSKNRDMKLIVESGLLDLRALPVR